MAYPMGFPPQGTGGAAADTRTSTIVVAASNSLDPTLAPAAYRCSGVNDEVEMNAALVAAAAVNGRVELLEGDYNTVLTLSVAINVALVGNGWGSVINFNAGGNAVTIAGNNVKLRDFKIVITAGAGGGGTRPSAIYATARTNVEITMLWLVGDETEADDGSDLRQCGIVFGINMAYSKIALCTIEDFDRHGISLLGTNLNESDYIEIEENITYSNTRSGIRAAYLDHSIIGDNTCQGNTTYGIYLTASESNTMSGNTCQGNTIQGIGLYAASHNNTITGNSCQDNVSHGIYLNASDGNTVNGNTSQGNTVQGIDLDGSDNNTVTGNTVRVNAMGIYVHGVSVNCTVTGNTVQNNSDQGINIGSSDNHTVTGNTSIGNDYGIYLSSSDGCTVTGNTCRGNTSYGIYLSGCVSNTISGNNSSGNTQSGIRNISASHNNTITGNTCFQNVQYGIHLDTSSNCTIVGNSCNENDVNDTGTYDGICVEDDSDYNIIHSNTCNNNDRWGISIGLAANDSVGNWLKDNHLRGNTSGPATDSGTGTVFDSVQFYCSEADDEHGAVPGKSITNGQFAYVGFHVPCEVQKIMRATLYVIPDATQAAANWDLAADYGAVGEAYNIHNETEAAATYNVTQNQNFSIDILAAGLLAAAVAHDNGGVSITVATAGHDLTLVFLELCFV